MSGRHTGVCLLPYGNMLDGLEKEDGARSAKKGTATTTSSAPCEKRGVFEQVEEVELPPVPPLGTGRRTPFGKLRAGEVGA
jgi:hypothetical protein